VNLKGSKNLGSDQFLFKSWNKNVRQFLLGISPISEIYMISSCYENSESGTVNARTLQGTTIFDRACVSDEFISEEVRVKKAH
jgi:Ca2+-dependent lipid-binding protein